MIKNSLPCRICWPEAIPKPSKVDVCHKGKIINVSRKAQSAHKVHGDAVDMDRVAFFILTTLTV